MTTPTPAMTAPATTPITTDLRDRAARIIEALSTELRGKPSSIDVYQRVSVREFEAHEGRCSFLRGGISMLQRGTAEVDELSSKLPPMLVSAENKCAFLDAHKPELDLLEAAEHLTCEDGDRRNVLRKSFKIVEYGTDFDYGAVPRYLNDWFVERGARLFGEPGLNELKAKITELQAKIDAARRDLTVRVERLEVELGIATV